MNDLALAWRRDLFSPRPLNTCATTTQTAAKARSYISYAALNPKQFAVARFFSPRPLNTCATTTKTAAKARSYGSNAALNPKQFDVARCISPMPLRIRSSASAALFLQSDWLTTAALEGPAGEVWEE